ncbi:BTB/POZ domain-containing protein 2-like [Chrysoperla carnea]|uniref:BTB/POZ domain-containing protein 2-like n=1 Tax=Chrysoperla carnea TaxID=189513 RepID=UPI001D05F4C0|nr:BTB/POZ domain-containing protein 2-like [Chrysoperla carnea]
MDSTNKDPKGSSNYLYNNQEQADIHFIVGNKKVRHRIPAHKFVLSVDSDVFNKMFFGSLRTNSKEIKISDIEPASFLALLDFFYTKEVQVNVETVMSTFYAAKKYNVTELKNHCIEYLKKNLTSDNVFFLLKQARLYDEPELATFCFDMLDKNISDALVSNSFTDIDLDTLIAVLERDTLQVFESKLFQAIIYWSIAECVRKQLPVKPENQRFVLGSALDLIRFSLMTFKEFTSGPMRSDILDYDKIKKFSLDIASNTNSTEIPRCSNKRSLECHLKFICKQHNLPPNQQTLFKDQFKFIRPGVIVGIVFYANMINYKSNVTLTLIDEKEGTICFRSEKCFDTPKLYIILDTFLPIMFNRPIMIDPDNSYRIEVQIEKRDVLALNKRMTSNGFIFGNDGKLLNNRRPADYFSFSSCSGIISEIIFFM